MYRRGPDSFIWTLHQKIFWRCTEEVQIHLFGRFIRRSSGDVQKRSRFIYLDASSEDLLEMYRRGPDSFIWTLHQKIFWRCTEEVQIHLFGRFIRRSSGDVQKRSRFIYLDASSEDLLEMYRRGPDSFIWTLHQKIFWRCTEEVQIHLFGRFIRRSSGDVQKRSRFIYLDASSEDLLEMYRRGPDSFIWTLHQKIFWRCTEEV